nr:NifU family protein [Candidatus Frankia alpina]
MADPVVEGGHRLDDRAVRERLTHLDEALDEALAQVERIPGPSGELALDAVATLASVYGEALARVAGYAAGAADMTAALTADELIGHLLVLHDVHPEPMGQRVTRAIERLRPAIRDRGGELELVGIERGVAEVSLTLGGAARRRGRSWTRCARPCWGSRPNCRTSGARPSRAAPTGPPSSPSTRCSTRRSPGACGRDDRVASRGRPRRRLGPGGAGRCHPGRAGR